MVAIQFTSEAAARVWHDIRSVPIATADGGSVFLDQALLADSLERLGIATPHPIPKLMDVDGAVNHVLQEATTTYAKVSAQIQINPTDVPSRFGTPIFVRPELQEHSWVRGFRQLRDELNRTVDQRLLLQQHTERLFLLHANGHLSEDRFLRVLRTLSRVDEAGIQAKQWAWQIERLVVLGSLQDLRIGEVGELWATTRVRDAADLLSGVGAGTDDVLDHAARMLHCPAYSVFSGQQHAVHAVDRFVEAAKDFRVGRSLASLSVLGLAFGAWQLFGGSAANSRASKIASLGVNGLGMLACSLASPLAIAGTIVSAGFLAFEACDFFGKQSMEMV
ncbi:MAG: hypothetical protein Q7S68_05590 [Deltaproteobacteria bacterium]|nr:hypothetical protein [Deltaproteobacteria bacterium]